MCRHPRVFVGQGEGEEWRSVKQRAIKNHHWSSRPTCQKNGADVHTYSADSRGVVTQWDSNSDGVGIPFWLLVSGVDPSQIKVYYTDERQEYKSTKWISVTAWCKPQRCLHSRCLADPQGKVAMLGKRKSMWSAAKAEGRHISWQSQAWSLFLTAGNLVGLCPQRAH